VKEVVVNNLLFYGLVLFRIMT